MYATVGFEPVISDFPGFNHCTWNRATLIVESAGDE